MDDQEKTKEQLIAELHDVRQKLSAVGCADSPPGVDAARRAGEERYRRLFEASSDGLVTVFPPDWRFTSGNAAMRHMFGIGSEGELCRYTPVDLSPEWQSNGERSEIKAQKFLQVAMDQGACYFEWTHKTVDGVCFPAVVSLTRIELEGRIGIQGSIRDITATKHVEESLRKRARLASFAAKVSMAFSIDQPVEAFLRYCAQRTVRLLEGGLVQFWTLGGADDCDVCEYREQCAAAESCLHLRASAGITEHLNGKHSRVPTDILAAAGVVEQRKIVWVNDIQHQMALSDTKWLIDHGLYAFVGIPLVIDGELLGVLGVFSAGQISVPIVRTLESVCQGIASTLARKRVEEVLREREAQVRAVSANLPSGVLYQVVIGRGGERTFSYVSGGVQRLLGCTPAEAIADPNCVYARFPEQDRQQWFDHEARSAVGLLSYTVEIRYYDLSDTLRWAYIAAKPRRVESGAIQWDGLLIDITNRKHAELIQQRLERKLSEGQKLESLGILAGGIAHDFNNLLTAILGHSDLAMRSLPSDEMAHKHVSHVVTGAQQAAELTQQLLAYSGRGRFVTQLVNLSDLVHEMGRLLEVTVSKKCLLRYHLSPETPHCHADSGQIRQIIVNLILNASEAVGEQSGLISISTGARWCHQAYLSEMQLSTGPSPGRYVYMEVADTGCGMSEETCRKIFDPFFTTKFTGRGLGLAAVLGIVRGHRGALKVTSEVGCGTTFTVLLPVVDDCVHEQEPITSALVHRGGSGTVLVVDDEETVRLAASEMLELMGFSVVVARDGREGIEVFRKHAQDLRCVLLDMTMPNLDGVEAYREMCRIDSTVPGILSSGYSEQLATSQLTDAGLAGFLQKPYRYSRLQEVIFDVLGDQPSTVK